MRHDHIEDDSNLKLDLKKFGLTMWSVLLFIAGLVFLRERTVNYALVSFAAFFIVFGCFFPFGLKHIYAFWMMFGLLMGRVTTRLILSILFYAVIFPLGIVLKLCGKDVLDVAIDKDCDSYWIIKNTVKSKDCYEKQF